MGRMKEYEMEHSMITHEQKLKLYAMGAYGFQPPPVPHAEWTDNDWINWIDKHGFWFKEAILDLHIPKVPQDIHQMEQWDFDWYEAMDCAD